MRLAILGIRKYLYRLWNSPTFTSWTTIVTTFLNIGLLLPLALTILPEGEFTLWLLFATVANLQHLFTFGLAPTFTRLIAYGLSGRNVLQMGSGRININISRVNEKSLKLVSMTMHRLFVYAAIFSLVAAATLGSLLIARPAGFSENVPQAWIAWSIFVVGSSMCLAGSGFGNYLMGLNKVALLQRWQTGFGIAGVLVSAVVLVNGGGLIGVVVVTQLVAVAGVIRNLWLCRVVPHGAHALHFGRKVDPDVWNVLWPASWRQGLAGIVYTGFINLSGLIYAQHADAAVLAAYLFVLRMVQTVGAFSQAPFYSRIPELAREFGSGSYDRVLQIASICMKRSYWVYVAGIIILAFAGNPLIEMLAKGRYILDVELLALLGFGFYLERISGMNLQLVALANLIYGHVGAIVSTGINLLICFIFASMLGIKAFALGVIAGQILFLCPYSSHQTSMVYQINAFRYNAMCAAWPLFAILISLGISIYIAS